MSHYTSPSDFELRFTIKGRPVSYKRGRRNYRGGSIKSKAAERWLKSALTQLAGRPAGLEPFMLPKSIPLHAEIHSYLGTRRNIDASNLLQGPEDALQRAGIIEDDSAIEHHDGSRRHYDKDDPRVEIILRPA
jgi:Holliday junction resolvase RusA-like endonuclease